MADAKYNKPDISVILAIFLAVIVLGTTQIIYVSRIEGTRPLGDQLTVSFTLVSIFVGAFIYFFQLISYLKPERHTLQSNILTVLAGGALIVFSSFTLPIFYSLISIGLFVIYLKMRQIRRDFENYDSSLFPEPFYTRTLEKFKRIRRAIFILFVSTSFVFVFLDGYEIVNNKSGVVAFVSDYLGYENANLEEFNEDLRSLPIDDDATQKHLFKNYSEMKTELYYEISYFRALTLLLGLFALLALTYAALVNIRVKGFPGNSLIRGHLKDAFWRIEDSSNDESNGTNNMKETKLNFIIPRLICIWPSIVSSLIAAHIAWQLQASAFNTIAIFISVFGTTAYGFTVNNIFDRKKDDIAKRKVLKLNRDHRLLKTANLVAIACLAIAIGSALLLPLNSMLLVSATLSILTVYSWINNRFGILANIITAFCAAGLVWVFPISLGSVSPEIIVLSSFIFLFVLSREIVMDHYDYESDRSYGKSSLPIYIGKSNALLVSIILLILTTSILAAVSFSLELNPTILFPILGSTILSIWGYWKYASKTNDSTFRVFFRITSLAYLTLFGFIM